MKYITHHTISQKLVIGGGINSKNTDVVVIQVTILVIPSKLYLIQKIMKHTPLPYRPHPEKRQTSLIFLLQKSQIVYIS